MDADSPIAEVRRAPRRARAQEWALALAAEGVSSRVKRAPGGDYALEVAPERLDRANEILDAYERENPEDAGRKTEAPPPPFSAAGFVIGGLLVAFFLITGERDHNVDWFAQGAADAARIHAGEYWRTVTALTLHADLRHALSNAVSGTLFIGSVCGSLGVGVGGALVLLAGAGGNWLNALFYGSHHISVGASTAVFGAVGVLSARAFVARRRRETRARPAWLALAAGLALLAMLGTGGERVDLWAHLFGWLAGTALGLPVVAVLWRPPSAWLQFALAIGCLLLLASCWISALY